MSIFRCRCIFFAILSHQRHILQPFHLAKKMFLDSAKNVHPIVIQTVIVSLKFCCYCYPSGNQPFIYFELSYHTIDKHSEYMF